MDRFTALLLLQRCTSGQLFHKSLMKKLSTRYIFYLIIYLGKILIFCKHWSRVKQRPHSHLFANLTLVMVNYWHQLQNFLSNHFIKFYKSLILSKIEMVWHYLNLMSFSDQELHSGSTSLFKLILAHCQVHASSKLLSATATCNSSNM